MTKIKTVYYTLLHACLIILIAGYYCLYNGWEIRAPIASQEAQLVSAVYDTDADRHAFKSHKR